VRRISGVAAMRGNTDSTGKRLAAGRTGAR